MGHLGSYLEGVGARGCDAFQRQLRDGAEGGGNEAHEAVLGAPGGRLAASAQLGGASKRRHLRRCRGARRPWDGEVIVTSVVLRAACKVDAVSDARCKQGASSPGVSTEGRTAVRVARPPSRQQLSRTGWRAPVQTCIRPEGAGCPGHTGRVGAGGGLVTDDGGWP
jgi:hypothetical protein